MPETHAARSQFFVSVPRVLNRIYQALKAATVDAPGFKGTLTRKAFGDKQWNLEHKGTVTHAFWDRIVFKKVRALLGGRVNFIASGSAPIAPEVLSFLKVAFSCAVTEGYGQTENCGTAVRCLTEDLIPNGTVGPPQAGVECMLLDVPEVLLLLLMNGPKLTEAIDHRWATSARTSRTREASFALAASS